jgi:hypothetical protein
MTSHDILIALKGRLTQLLSPRVAAADVAYSHSKVTAAKKYTKIPLGQAQGDAYLFFRCLS